MRLDMALLLVIGLSLAGCHTEERQQSDSAPAGKPDKGLTSATQAPTGAVPFQIGGAIGAAVLINGREFRIFLQTARGENVSLQANGTLQIDGKSSPPMQLYPNRPNGEYRYALSRQPVKLPVAVTADIQIVGGQKGSVSFSIPESAGVTIVPKNGPEITTAGLNMVIAGDKAFLGVMGTNFANAQLLLQSENAEVNLPLDHESDTELAVLDTSNESLIGPGKWDIVVRTPNGNAVLTEAIVKPAD